jgi:hypothetical protein
MWKRAGRNYPISPFRRLVIDLMHFCQQVPSATVDRRMNLQALLLQRQRCVPRPGWCTLFGKAFAIVAARVPELRRVYLPFPWPRLYEHARNIGTVTVARQYGQESIVIQAQIRSPECRSLEELDALVRGYKENPLSTVRPFCRAMTLGRLPGPLRRLVWWVTLNFLGRRRAHNFGTFGVTSTSAHGAGVLYLRPLAATVHYGLFDDSGCLDVRFSFDHRVLDGAIAAQALVDLEAVLLGEILDEVRNMTKPTSKAA